MTTETLEFNVRISATPRDVFPYFTDTAKLLRWQGVDASLDPRPGGIFRVAFSGGEIVVGTFVEVVPYHRVVYTWGFETPVDPSFPPGASTVVVDLTADGDETVVSVKHSGLPAGLVEFHAFGWNDTLPALPAAVEARV